MSRIAAAIRLRELGRPREALEQLLRELADDPRSVRARFELVWVYIALRNKESAQRVADEVLELEPESPWAMHAKANAHGGFSENAQALPFVDRALELAPRTSVFHSYRAALCLNLGQPSEALASVDLALELDPWSPYSLEVRIRVLRALGREPDALAATRAALSAHPENAKLLQHLGELSLGAGDAATAGEAFRAELAQDPSRTEAKTGLVRALRARSTIYRRLSTFVAWTEKQAARVRTKRIKIGMATWVVITFATTGFVRDPFWLWVVLGPIALVLHVGVVWFVPYALARFALPMFLVPVMFDATGKHALEESMLARWKRSPKVGMASIVVLGVLAFFWPWVGYPLIYLMTIYVSGQFPGGLVRQAQFFVATFAAIAASIGSWMAWHATTPYRAAFHIFAGFVFALPFATILVLGPFRRSKRLRMRTRTSQANP